MFGAPYIRSSPLVDSFSFPQPDARHIINPFARMRSEGAHAHGALRDTRTSRDPTMRSQVWYSSLTVQLRTTMFHTACYYILLVKFYRNTQN